MPEPGPETLIGLLEDAAQRHGARAAVTSQEGLRSHVLTYGGLFGAAGRVAARLLHGEGLVPGDRVVLWAPNSARLVAIQFGLYRAGLVAVPMDQGARPDFVAEVIRRTGARALVSLPGRAAPGLPPILDVGGFELDEGPVFDGPGPAPGDVALIVFTSGTTGDPKGVVLTHANVTANVRAAASIIPADRRLELLSILPLSHMLEQTAGLHLPLLNGGSVHYARSLRPTSIIEDMRRHRVSGMVVVPRFLQMMAARIDDRMAARRLGGLYRQRRALARALPFALRRFLFPDLRRALGGRIDHFLCGGAGLPAATFGQWEEFGIRVIEGYGTTECAPIIAANTYGERRAGSVGFPLPGVETRLSDEGELQVRGPGVFPGYWQAEEATRAAFTADGWYRTGDIARIGSDGRIAIEARLSERIVLPSGMNVYPADVEAALAGEAAVAEAAVLGLRGPGGEEQVHAAIRPGEGADAGAVAEAVARANTRLASHQRILGHSLWEADFPRTPLGKVRRAELRRALAAKGDRPGPATAPGTAEGLAESLLRRLLPGHRGAIGPGSHLERDLGLDSLGRLELAALIETETGEEIPEEAVNTAGTVADLAALLEGQRGPAARRGFPDWPLARAAVTARALLQGALLFPLLGRVCSPFRVQGADALAGLAPPVLLVANHASHADTLSILRALPAGLRRRTAAAAAADYFYASRLKGGVASLLLNTFPFSRGGDVRRSLERCGELCDRGWSILIYPEGTRSPDDSLQPFKHGVSLLAAGLKVPVVPVGVAGGHAVLPKGRRWPRRAPVAVSFGAPLVLPGEVAPEEITTLMRDAVTAELASAETMRAGDDHRRERP